MAVRRPLYLNGSGDIVEMTSAQVDEVIQRTIYRWSLSPNIQLTVSSANSGISMDAMFDTRMQAGADGTRTDRFPTAAELDNISQVDVKYDRIYADYILSSVTTPTSAAINPFIAPAGSYPLYRTSGGDIRAMNLTDCLNTFAEPAITLLTTGSAIGDSQAGTFFISTSTSVANATLANGSNLGGGTILPVFTDTIADAAAYTAAGIPEALDQPSTQANYYLHRRNYSAGKPFCQNMLEIATNNDIQAYNTSRMDNMLDQVITYATREHAGYRIDYSIGTSGSGSIRGNGMTDTRLNGSGVRLTYGADTGSTSPNDAEDDYRAQEMPNGTAVNVNTYYLRIFKF